MSNFIIYTDSACDIPVEKLNEWGVKYIELSYMFEGEDVQHLNYDLPAGDFYNEMRAGKVAKTSAANVASFKDFFEEGLKQGNNILYIGFSSGLSTTLNSANIAADELKEKYPDRKIITVDTLAASLGMGLLLYFATKKKAEGATLEETAEYIESIKLNLCHWFTVDDLVYLKRGGRISPSVAFVGGLLGIKPVLHMDNEGHLINMFKVRGRKASIQAIADKYGELAINKGDPDDTLFICHGDCIDDANELANIVKKKYGVNVMLIGYTGPVIGAHSGPGTLALFFLGKER